MFNQRYTLNRKEIESVNSTLVGFGGVLLGPKNRYYLKPGYLFVSNKPYIIQTILGSCVSVCLWDRNRKYGGMTHYIYDFPGNDADKPIYGSISIPYLVKQMGKFGSKIASLEAYIVGGARSDILTSSIVGKNNINIAIEILTDRNIKIKGTEIEGNNGKKVIFNTLSGEVKVIKIQKYRKGYLHGKY